MAFTHDPTTSAGLCRTNVADTDSTDYVFEDAEIDAVLDQNSDDVWSASADLCRALAAKYAKEAFDLGLGKGDIKLDRRKKAEYYLQLAKTYEGKSSSSDVIEYMDHYNINVTGLGVDDSEYIGDT